MNLHGIFPPLTTPFAGDGSLELDRLRENITRYNRTRLAGYVLNGSTGESVLLSWDEVERVWEVAREAVTPEKILIAGTGAESTTETIEHTNRAAEHSRPAELATTAHTFLITLSARPRFFNNMPRSSKARAERGTLLILFLASAP